MATYSFKQFDFNVFKNLITNQINKTFCHITDMVSFNVANIELVLIISIQKLRNNISCQVAGIYSQNWSFRNCIINQFAGRYNGGAIGEIYNKVHFTQFKN